MDLIPLDESEPILLDETEPIPPKKQDRSVLIVWGIIILLLLLSVCAGSYILFARLRTPAATPTPAFPTSYLPATNLATPTPIMKKLVRLPVVLSGQVPVWQVTKVKSLGYKIGNQRYDLATFTRLDNGSTAQGYCINRGWDVPKVGAPYLLTSQNIFVPLQERKPNTMQRFQKIN
jgi:hypothetical protein